MMEKFASPPKNKVNLKSRNPNKQNINPIKLPATANTASTTPTVKQTVKTFYFQPFFKVNVVLHSYL